MVEKKIIKKIKKTRRSPREHHRSGTIRQGGVKVKSTTVNKGVHYKPKIMNKKVPSNIIKGFQETSKSTNEFSYGVDFERSMKQPERFFAQKGGISTTIKFDDFELFGHSHPFEEKPLPSMADLRCLDPNETQFIVAGKSGNIIFYRVERPNQFKQFLEKHKNEGDHSLPHNLRGDFTDPNNGEAFKDVYFNLIGVRVYPYKEGMTIKIKDDPKLEKTISIPSDYWMQKWKTEKENLKATNKERETEAKRDKKKAKFERYVDGKRYRTIGLERTNKAEAEEDCKRITSRSGKEAIVIKSKKKGQTIFTAYIIEKNQNNNKSN